MDSCRLDLPDWIPQNGLSPSSGIEGEQNELQLAGLLGKTLLERNSDLEAKLKRLEEFTEETLNTNKALSRQVREYRESLQFANKSCEHLEQKLEESESELKEVKLASVKQEVALQTKINIIKDLQLAMDALESDNMQLQEDLKSSSISLDSSNNVDSLSRLERSQSCAIVSEGGETGRKLKEFQETVDDLMKRLNDSHYQRTKMKQSVEAISSENKRLRELVMKTESEVIDLQTQVKILEETAPSERSQPATPIPTPLSPGRRGLLPSLSLCGACPHCNGNLIGFEDSLTTSDAVSSTTGARATGHTLFSELQNDTLQLKFDKLLQDCTCAASIPYKDVTLDTPPPYNETTAMDSPSGACTKADDSSNASLKDLFEEVYASLKKSSIVADQLLLTRKKGGVSP